MDSQTLGQKLQSISSRLESMTPVDRSAVVDNLMNRVDYFRPQYEELRGVEQEAYAAPGTTLEQYYGQDMTGGASDVGPSALGIWNSMMGESGRRYALADTLNDVLRGQQGRIEQLADRALGSYQTEREGLLDQRDFTNQLYQSALAREEAAAARRAAARNAALMAGGGGFGGFPQGQMGGGPNQQGISIEVDPMARVRELEAQRNAAKTKSQFVQNRVLKPITSQLQDAYKRATQASGIYGGFKGTNKTAYTRGPGGSIIQTATF